MSQAQLGSLIGWWTGQRVCMPSDPASLHAALHELDQPLYVIDTVEGPACGVGGSAMMGHEVGDPSAYPSYGYVPPGRVSALGDRTFCQDHGLAYPYVSGAMAGGIGSADIVEAMAGAGMLGFFGAAGLPVERVEAAIDRIQKNVGNGPYGFNLIHSPNEPRLEAGVVAMYLQRGVHLIEASAFLDLTLPVVRYRVHGIHRGPNGEVVTPNRVIAKVSRVEVATKFFAPPPARFLSALVESGDITPEQAELAQYIPVAQDITAEADSGGHTDNRPALGLIPTLLAVRDRARAQHQFAQALRVGAAGGIATPASTAAAFAMGASYVLVGTVHQSCLESGTSDLVREMLAQAEQADVAMCPAADMFEMGVKVQVLKRGTMFAMRASKLYDIYRAYKTIEEIPTKERETLEKSFFRVPLDEVWQQTETFFATRDPAQNERAAKDPHHKMALIFRWYLGQSSRWANAGIADRRMDYQVWCGPSMGAFNEWVRGSFLEQTANRRVVTVARNLLYGAAVLSRVNALRGQGFPVPAEAAQVSPQTPESLERWFSA